MFWKLDHCVLSKGVIPLIYFAGMDPIQIREPQSTFPSPTALPPLHFRSLVADKDAGGTRGQGGSAARSVERDRAKKRHGRLMASMAYLSHNSKY